MSLSDRTRLARLLARRADFPHLAPTIDVEITRRFERTVAVLVLDMCGFSRLTARHGVVFYLAMIHRMHAAAFPAVTDNRGTVIKTVADNLFAVFPTAADALESALDIHRALAAANAATPADHDLHGSIGIGYGPTLLLDDADLFGHEVNCASRLGEDLATTDETLLTPSAHTHLPPNTYHCTPTTYHHHAHPVPALRYTRRL